LFVFVISYWSLVIGHWEVFKFLWCFGFLGENSFCVLAYWREVGYWSLVIGGGDNNPINFETSYCSLIGNEVLTSSMVFNKSFC
jgi:hypothetical protein